MDKKELEELKERIENAEFNNAEEDIKVNNEENEEEMKQKKDNDFKDINDKKKNIIIIALIGCVLILLILLIILLPGDKKENNNNTNSNSEITPSDKEDPEVIKEEDYNYSDAKLYFNKYIYVRSNDESKKIITDLDGNLIAKTEGSWKIYEGNNKDLYLVDSKDNDTFVIKRIKDNLLHDVFNDNASGLILGKEKENLLGLYKKEKDYDIIYLLNENSYNTINLDSFGSFTNSKKEIKYIYNNRYVITYNNKDQKEYDSYGIYDLKDKKQLIDETYDKIEFLHDNVFVAIKDDKTGVIDTNNKVLLDFKYDLVTYSNGLYFVGDDNKLLIYDSNLNSLNKEIEVSNLDKYTYNPSSQTTNPFDLINYKSYVIVRIGYLPDAVSDYVIVDKKGNITELGKGYIGFAGQYLINSNTEDNFIYMYDESLNVAHKIDVGEKAIKLDKVNIFLNNTLTINGSKLYNLSNDTAKGTTNWYRRESQEFNVKIDFKGDNGTITVSSNEIVLKKLENVSLDAFLKAENNGITITKDYFIYNADGVIVLKRVEQNKEE